MQGSVIEVPAVSLGAHCCGDLGAGRQVVATWHLLELSYRDMGTGGWFYSPPTGRRLPQRPLLLPLPTLWTVWAVFPQALPQRLQRDTQWP